MCKLSLPIAKAYRRSVKAGRSLAKLVRAHYRIAIVSGVLLAGAGVWGGMHVAANTDLQITKSGVRIAKAKDLKAGEQSTQVTAAGGTVTGASGSTAMNKPASSTSMGAGAKATAGTAAHTVPKLAGYNPCVSGKNLVATPSKVTLTATQGGAYVTISNASNTAMYRPEPSTLPGLMTFIDYGYVGPEGGRASQKSWSLQITRLDYNTGGQGYITVKDYLSCTVNIPISWSPAPRFELVKGHVTRTDGVDTVTHTAHFSIVPNHPYFGNPTLTIRMYGMGGCLNTHELSRTFVYSGQNSFSLSCVVQKVPPHVIGTPPPPIPGYASFNIDVYGMIGSEFIRGPYPISYVLEPGYDR